jgi:uncharacterized protein
VLEIAGAVGMVAVASALAFRPAFLGTYWVFAILAAPYIAMTVVYVLRTAREGMTATKLRPRSGDLTLGFAIAALLFLCVVVGRSALTPTGSGREAWLMRLYMQVGGPSWVQKNLIALSLITGLLGALEEIAWRGYVLSELNRRIGRRGAWPTTAALNAAAYIPTMLLASDPRAGLNPLLVLVALGSGLAWGFLVSLTDRLPVAIISHALFAWALIVQFPLWRLAY